MLSRINKPFYDSLGVPGRFIARDKEVFLPIKEEEASPIGRG